jgi:hypothetical protein
MSEVWLVMSGGYDEYVICAAATKADAEQIMAKVNEADHYPDARIVCTTILTGDVQRVRFASMVATRWDNGIITRGDRVNFEWIPEPVHIEAYPWQLVHAQPCRWRWVRAPIHEGKGGRLEVNGTDEALVRSTFAELLYRLNTDANFRRRKEATG